MKALVIKETWTVKLDNEAIKAIRFCNGFTTDLRVILKGANKSALYDWIEANKLGLFGPDFLVLCVSSTDDNWNRYEKMIKNVVSQVVGY